jgi:hypothetical protein
MIPRLLPEFCYSKHLLNLEGITLHYISAIYAAPDRWDDVDTIWNMLVEINQPKAFRGPLLERIEGRTEREADCYASYHLLIDRDGNGYQLTPWERRAFHAGVSEWKGRKNCNAWMAGIALVGTKDSGYTDAQYATLIEDCRFLRQKQIIPLNNITGHEHVAPGRKQDPGPLFDWSRLKTNL